MLAKNLAQLPSFILALSDIQFLSDLCQWVETHFLTREPVTEFLLFRE